MPRLTSFGSYQEARLGEVKLIYEVCNADQRVIVQSRWPILYKLRAPESGYSLAEVRFGTGGRADVELFRDLGSGLGPCLMTIHLGSRIQVIDGRTATCCVQICDASDSSSMALAGVDSPGSKVFEKALVEAHSVIRTPGSGKVLAEIRNAWKDKDVARGVSKFLLLDLEPSPFDRATVLLASFAVAASELYVDPTKID